MSQRSRTTAAIRRAIQHSDSSIRELARRYSINPKTVAKWRQRDFTGDLKTGPKQARALGRARLEEAVILVFRAHVILPLNDSLQTLQVALPQLTRSSLHRILQRHDLSLAARTERSNMALGHVTLGVTAIGALRLLVGVESQSKYVYAQLHADSSDATATTFLRDLSGALPCDLERIVTPRLPAFLGATFRALCNELDVSHHISEDSHAWSAERLQHVEDVVRETLTKLNGGPAGASLEQLRSALNDLVAHHNTRTSLMVLGGLSPQGYLESRRDSAAASRTQPTRSRKIAVRTERSRSGNGNGMRAPEHTREAILEAAITCLAQDGPEGLSLAEVARIAGVNRGTAYQHFETREKLIAATAEWVSDSVQRALFGDGAEQPLEQVDIAAHMDRLTTFAMDNPAICRAWLLQVLASPDPQNDPFLRRFSNAIARFSERDGAQTHVDSDVLSLILAAGLFLWPVYARAQAQNEKDRRTLAYRFAQEALRMSMYGNLHADRFPAIAKRLRNYRFEAASKTKDGD